MSFSKIKFFEFFVQKIACKGKESKYKPEVLHEEFLWSYFFKKILIFPNIFIYCDFFISQILFDVPPIEASSTFLPIKFIEDHIIAYFGKESKYKSRRSFNWWYIEKYLKYEEIAIYEDVWKDQNLFKKIRS